MASVHSALEVADILRIHGPAWRAAQSGHLSLGQLKVMSATQCRSAALGGHVLRCDGCGADQVSYNSCRNRHCPKCQSNVARRWLEARQADLLPVEYFHVVFTLPAPIADLAYQNKAAICGLLFDMAAEVLQTIAADAEHLGARIGATLVLHTWGSALTHHPHVHGIVPGGGLAADGKTWIACRSGFFLPVRVLSRLFRRRFLDGLQELHRMGRLQFFGEHAALQDAKLFTEWLTPMRQQEWVVYAKRPLAGPQAMLAYLSRYTHRMAISNSRLVALDERGVTFRWKDYRAKGSTRHKTIKLEPQEFMRRFLLHVLPGGFHRIRHYGLLANGNRRESLALARAALQAKVEVPVTEPTTRVPTFVCRHCGRLLLIVKVVLRERPSIRAPTVVIGVMGPAPLPTRPLASYPSCHARQAAEPNRHSDRAFDNRCHMRRGFLPRGLSNTCPQIGVTRRPALRDGQVSDKPKLLPTLRAALVEDRS